MLCPLVYIYPKVANMNFMKPRVADMNDVTVD